MSYRRVQKEYEIELSTVTRKFKDFPVKIKELYRKYIFMHFLLLGNDFAN